LEIFGWMNRQSVPQGIAERISKFSREPELIKKRVATLQPPL